jgi:hypothetical protein
LNDEYPPALSGQDETDFTTDANANKTDCLAQLSEPEFSGLTPSTLSQPIGSTMIEWFEVMANDALAVLEAASPPPSDVQRAADEYHTMAARTADLISAYT